MNTLELIAQIVQASASTRVHDDVSKGATMVIHELTAQPGYNIFSDIPRDRIPELRAELLSKIQHANSLRPVTDVTAVRGRDIFFGAMANA